MECTVSAACRWAAAAAGEAVACRAVGGIRAGVAAFLAASLAADGIRMAQICRGCSEGGQRIASVGSECSRPGAVGGGGSRGGASDHDQGAPTMLWREGWCRLSSTCSGGWHQWCQWLLDMMASSASEVSVGAAARNVCGGGNRWEAVRNTASRGEHAGTAFPDPTRLIPIPVAGRRRLVHLTHCTWGVQWPMQGTVWCAWDSEERRPVEWRYAHRPAASQRRLAPSCI